MIQNTYTHCTTLPLIAKLTFLFSMCTSSQQSRASTSMSCGEHVAASACASPLRGASRKRVTKSRASLDLPGPGGCDSAERTCKVIVFKVRVVWLMVRWLDVM